jgi:glycosyltransferase involved in cell wall biosynthesis
VPEPAVTEPRIEFVMPVFNGARFLPDALDSLLAQDRRDWQLLAVDDASTDESLAILREYAAADRRIRVRAQGVNRGLYGTLAAAVDEGEAEWVGILMQDDRLRPEYVAEMSALVERYPAAEAFWATEDTIDADGRIVARGPDTARVEPIRPGIEPWRRALARGCLWTISGSLTRRRLLQTVRLRTDLPHCGDYEWFLRAVRARSFVYYERPLTELRRHPGQASTRHLGRGQDLREARQVIREQVRAHPRDLTVGRALRVGSRRAAAGVVRLVAALRHGRWRQVWPLLQYVAGHLRLPLEVAGLRLRRRPAPPAEESP